MRIVSGSIVEGGPPKWMARLDLDGSWTKYCSGAVISRRYVFENGTVQVQNLFFMPSDTFCRPLTVSASTAGMSLPLTAVSSSSDFPNMSRPELDRATDTSAKDSLTRLKRSLYIRSTGRNAGHTYAASRFVAQSLLVIHATLVNFLALYDFRTQKGTPVKTT